MATKITNGEIWEAYPNLVKLSQLKLPIRTSFELAKMVGIITPIYSVIEGQRNALITQYGKQIKNTNQFQVPPDKLKKYTSELSELFSIEEELTFDKVKLPEKVSSTCDKCKHNIDKPLEIEPAILIPLEKFVGLA